MKLLKPSKMFILLIISLLSVSLLTACGARRSPPATVQPAAPQATQARPTTSAPQPTNVPPASAIPQATAIPPTQAATVVPPTATPTHTPAPAATATAQPDTSGAALDQLLQKLEEANSAGDSLNDVPELK